MSVIFVGAFNPIIHDMNNSSSGAGAKVQYEIIKAISDVNPELKSLVLQEVRTWPFKDFFIKGKFVDDIHFLPMLNFFFLKNIYFGLYVFFKLLVLNPNVIYFYNTSPSMNLFMFLLGLIRKKQVKILIIQDLHAPRGLALKKLYRIDKVMQYFLFKLTKFSFNYFVPITKQLAAHLKFPEDKCHPFLGGVLDAYVERGSLEVRDIAVFAGALEKYNGVDYLLDAWSRSDLSKELHIFGTGSLAEMAKLHSCKNKNIIYHGFKSPLIVKQYIGTASVNFCFRYSRGIDEEFFFPSKFFDVVSNPGLVVCNRFKNLPKELESSIYFVNDDFSNFEMIMKSIDTMPSYYENRSRIVLNNYSWPSLINSISRVLGV